MLSDNIAVKAYKLSKHYRIWKSQSARLRASIWSLVKRYDPEYTSRLFTTFKALDDVSLSIEKGESVGIIGRNGAGKSTLLQIIAGTLKQTSGEIHTAGKVAALLELGSGFNPEFTGRENISINASILGLDQKQITERTPSIIEYSEIEEFIDQPVKTYSSGMQMRLAFSIAIHVDAEIFIIDEALSVGDAWFQLKCSKTMDALVRSGKTFLLVSHSPIAIKQYCNRAILLEKGTIIEQGDPNDVCNRYSQIITGIADREEKKTISNIEKKTSSSAPEVPETVPQPTREHRLEQVVRRLLDRKQSDLLKSRDLSEFEYGKDQGHLSNITIEDENGNHKGIFLPRESIHLKFIATSKVSIENSIFGFTVKQASGLEAYLSNTLYINQEVPAFSPEDSIEVTIKSTNNLMPGEYFISIGWVHDNTQGIKVIHRKYDFAKITILAEDHCVGIANLYSAFSFKKL